MFERNWNYTLHGTLSVNNSGGKRDDTKHLNTTEIDCRYTFPSNHLGFLDDIFQFAALVPHLASHKEQPDYLAEVEEVAELSDMREEVLTRVSTALSQVCTYTSECSQLGPPWPPLATIIDLRKGPTWSKTLIFSWQCYIKVHCTARELPITLCFVSVAASIAEIRTFEMWDLYCLYICRVRMVGHSYV